MADVASAFIRGHQAGQAEKTQEQEQEQRGLHAMILKHELARLKIHDALEDYAAKHGASEARFNAQQGQPEGSFGKETKTSVKGSSYPGAPVTDIPVTPFEGNKAPQPIEFPGLPTEVGGGSPGYTKTPKTAQELVHSMIMNELAKPQKTRAGETVTIPALGDKPIAQGGPTFHSVGAGGLATTDAAGATKVVVPARAPTAPRPLVVNGQIRDPNDPTKVIAIVPPQVRPSSGDAAQDRKDRAAEAKSRFMYSTQVAAERRKHAEQLKTWQKASEGAVNGVNVQTGKPVGEMPEYDQPTYEEWQAKRAPNPAGGTADVDPLVVTYVGPDGATKSFKAPTKTAADAMRKELGIK